MLKLNTTNFNTHTAWTYPFFNSIYIQRYLLDIYKSSSNYATDLRGLLALKCQATDKPKALISQRGSPLSFRLIQLCYNPLAILFSIRFISHPFTCSRWCIFLQNPYPIATPQTVLSWWHQPPLSYSTRDITTKSLQLIKHPKV